MLHSFFFGLIPEDLHATVILEGDVHAIGITNRGDHFLPQLFRLAGQLVDDGSAGLLGGGIIDDLLETQAHQLGLGRGFGCRGWFLLGAGGLCHENAHLYWLNIQYRYLVWLGNGLGWVGNKKPACAGSYRADGELALDWVSVDHEEKSAQRRSAGLPKISRSSHYVQVVQEW